MFPDDVETAEDAVTGPDESSDEIVAGPTKAELYEEAQELDIEGRSSMDKDELAEAVEREREGVELSAQPDADVTLPDPKAAARAEAELAQTRARPEGEPDADAPEGLECAAHGGVLAVQAGKFRWRCDRAVVDGECVPEPVDA